jgi:competence protein ComEA
MRIRSFAVAAVASFCVLSNIHAQDLPEGEGKAVVEKVCTACHGADSFVGIRDDRKGWEGTVKSMMDRGAEATPAEIETIVTYLAAHFGQAAAGQDSAKINVNKATAKDIETGLDLSPEEAAAIVKYREDHGDFKVWQDLTKAPGVDAGKIEAKTDSLAF